MIVTCLKCGSSEVVMTTDAKVDFQFDRNGDVKFFTDIADEIYWSIEYNGAQAICKCKRCGYKFNYSDWKENLK